MDKELPVIVMDEGGRGDVGLVRSLGRADISVHLASPDGSSPTRSSRYVDHVHEWCPPDASDARRLEGLRAIARRVDGRPPVMMSGDGSLALVSNYREVLEDVVCFDLPPKSVVDICFNKDRFAPASRRLELPVPETHSVTSLQSAKQLAPELQYPVFVKPFTKADWAALPSGAVDSRKGQPVHSPDALVDLFHVLAEHGADTALVQRFVDSPDSEHYSVHAYVMPDGSFAGAFTTRKLRVYPPRRGVGCLVVSERVPRIVNLSRQVLDRLDYRGFALIQYKRDLVRDEFVLLEVNCRFSTSGELPMRCGANFPALSYAVLTDGERPSISQREGPVWLDLERDWSAIRMYRERGELGWPKVIRSLAGVRYEAFFGIDDPGPFISYSVHRARRKMRNWRTSVS